MGVPVSLLVLPQAQALAAVPVSHPSVSSMKETSQAVMPNISKTPSQLKKQNVTQSTTNTASDSAKTSAAKTDDIKTTDSKIDNEDAEFLPEPLPLVVTDASIENPADETDTSNSVASNDTMSNDTTSNNNKNSTAADLSTQSDLLTAQPSSVSQNITSQENSTLQDISHNQSKLGAIPKFLDRSIKNITKNEFIEDDEAARSLNRLAQFYQYHNDASSAQDVQTPNLPQNAQSNLQPTTETLKQAPVLAPSIYYRTGRLSPARCSGAWVNPVLPTGYHRALQQLAPQTDNDNNSTSLSSQAQPPNTLPLFAEADYAYYDSLSYLELAGDVRVIQAGQLIQSDQLVLDLNQGVSGAKGNVLFTDSATNTNIETESTQVSNPANLLSQTPQTTQQRQNGTGLIGVAGELAYNSNGQATAHDVAFASIPMQAHGYAKRLNRPSDTLFEFDKVMFSTCPPDDRKWQLEAQQIDLDTATGRGEAYDTTFRLGNVPVFYLPYFNFPIDSRRASGFLLPRASIDTKSGVQISLPYYLNLAPNYDATLTTQIFSNRNPMLTGELRYLTKEYGAGKLVASYLPNDKQYNNEDRKGLFYSQNWTSSSIPHLSANGVYNYVSDSRYLNDFDSLGLSDNAINLPRRAEANYYNDYLNGQFKIETFQSLNATDADGNRVPDKDKPYSRLPQLSIDYRLPWFSKLNITGVHDSAYFKKSIKDGSENEKSGVRVFNQLSASYPLQRSWGYLTPKVSLQHLYTAYDETSRLDNNLSKKDRSQTVFVPQYSIDVGLKFYRAGSPFNWFDNTLGGYQLLSPRLKYVYAPYRDQSDVPNFNTRIASVNYSQLFADSWFLGHDRLPDNNAVTPGINYRYIDAMGVTRYDASIGKQFYLNDERVTLSSNDTIFTDANSGVVWNSSAKPYQNLSVDFNGALKSDYSVNFVTTQLRYQPTPDSLFNFGYIKRLADDNTNQQPLSAFTASTIFPIKDNWRILGQGQYDNRSNRMIDALVGVDYQDCCYGFAIYGRSYYNDLNLDKDPTRAIMAEFRIKGFGNSNDSRLTHLLSNKILGFEPVDTYWKQ